ncbi:MAG: hypothetical protein LBD48_00410 [Treponema sp.]|jgi:hypothetical protein|nr:hypothetical protein [Treponema sp.]
MASEKKPSIYSDRSSIGSAEELDQYGVWVKSEPRDLTASEPGMDDFDALSLPEMGEVPAFDVGLGEETGIEDFSIPGLPDLPEAADDAAPGFDDPAASEVDLSSGFEKRETDFNSDTFEGPAVEESGQPAASAELSTKLLMKIADELSSIRTELTTLKKEFAGIRAETGGEEDHRGGFFAEEDDEKIALTGDEMDNILTTAGLDSGDTQDGAEDIAEAETPGETGPVDEGPFAAETGDDEEIELDLDDLGINLDEIEVPPDENALAQTAPEDLDVSLDTDFNIDLPPDEAGETAAELPDSGLDDGLAELEALDDSEELRNIRLEGIEPLTAPPEDTAYLEEDPFAAGLDDISLAGELDEPAIDLSAAGDESIIPPDNAGGEHPFDAASLDLSEAVIDEPDLSADITENPVQEPVLDDIVLDDDISIELEEEEQPENLTGGDMFSETGDELAVIPEAFEKITEEILVPFDDELDPLAEDDISPDETFTKNTAEPELPPVIEADSPEGAIAGIPPGIRKELKNVLSYMDHLLESLPEEKIEEFAQSEYFDTYKKLFRDLGLV